LAEHRFRLDRWQFSEIENNLVSFDFNDLSAESTLLQSLPKGTPIHVVGANIKTSPTTLVDEHLNVKVRNSVGFRRVVTTCQWIQEKADMHIPNFNSSGDSSVAALLLLIFLAILIAMAV